MTNSVIQILSCKLLQGLLDNPAKWGLWKFSFFGFNFILLKTLFYYEMLKNTTSLNNGFCTQKCA